MNNHNVVPNPLNPAQLPQKLLFSRKEAAFALSISVRLLDYLIERRRIATRRIGKRVLIARAALIAFVRGDQHLLTDN